MGEKVSQKGNTDIIPIDEELGEHPAYVMVKGGVTRNLGDYNSISVQVSIGMPCKNTMEAVDKMYGIVSNKVDELVERETKLATEGDTEGVTDRI